MSRNKSRSWRVNQPTSKFFQGEIMTCKNCGKQQKSDPHISSDWTAIELDGKLYGYFCPHCFGNAQESQPGEK
jgi:hypothetical protein